MSIVTQPQGIAMSRSPIIYRVDLPSGTWTGVKWYAKVWIWAGDSAARPAQPNYELLKYPTATGEAIYDISRLVYSELTARSFAQFTSAINAGVGHAVWVQVSFDFTSNEDADVAPVVSNIILATAGFYDYQNGINQPYQPYSTPATYTRRVSPTQRLYLPIHIFNGADNMKLTSDGGDTVDIPILLDEDTASNNVFYMDVSPDRLAALNIDVVQTFEVLVRNNLGVTISTWRIEYVCEPKYTPVAITYLNRYGVWDCLTFFKKSSKQMEITGEKYQNNHLWPYAPTPTGKFYDIAFGQNRAYNKNAKQMLALNTEWLTEEGNEQVQDLLVSERVFMQVGALDIGVIVSTQGLEIKSTVNDKLIQYTILFEQSSYINTAAV